MRRIKIRDGKFSNLKNRYQTDVQLAFVLLESLVIISGGGHKEFQNKEFPRSSWKEHLARILVQKGVLARRKKGKFFGSFH